MERLTKSEITIAAKAISSGCGQTTDTIILVGKSAIIAVGYQIASVERFKNITTIEGVDCYCRLSGAKHGKPQETLREKLIRTLGI